MGSSSDPRPPASGPPSVLREPLDRALVGHERVKLGVVLAGIAELPVWIEGPPGSGRTSLLCVAERLFGPTGRLSPTGGGREEAAGRGPDDVERLAPERLRALERELDGPAAGAVFAVAGAPDERHERLLSRFPLRLALASLVQSPGSRSARELLERASAGSLPAEPGEAPGLPDLEPFRLRVDALRRRARTLCLPEEVRSAVERWIEERPRVDARCVLALLALLRARAALRGADRVEPRDLSVLRWLHLAAPARPSQLSAGSDPAESGCPLPSPGAPGDAIRAPGDGAGRALGLPEPTGCRDLELPAARDTAPSPQSGPPGTAIEALSRALRGRRGRGSSRRVPDVSGAPRAHRALRDWDEIADADPAELVEYLDGARAERPRVALRQRRRGPGALVILRDVSASMQGPVGRWCARLCVALVDLAEQQRLRIGLVEFHHDADRYTVNGRLLHGAYPAVRRRVARPRAEGATSYEAPLRALLGATPAASAGDAVLITDGVPVRGDPRIASERARARALGWCLHTVFVGLGDPPPVLAEVARETGGLAARVRPRPGGAFHLERVA